MKTPILVSHVFIILACLTALVQVPTAAAESARPGISQAAAGHTLYVSTNGSDSSGDGSITHPFRTIAQALAAAVAGDEIVLRGAPALANNRYQESVRIQLPNITLRSETGEQAILECPINIEDISECVRLDVDSDGAHLKDLEIIGGYYYGIKFETRWDWGDPNDRTGASDILIEDVVIHDTGRDAVKITPGCDDITLRRVEIYNTGARDDSNAEGIDNVNGDRMIVQDSYIHDIATTGVYFKGGAMDGIIERNRIEHTGGAGILVGFDTSPEYFDLTVNPNYYENIRGIVRNNLVRDTVYAGIGLYAARDAQVLNNTLIDTAQTAHSPIYFGVTYQDWEPYAGRPPSLNPILRNNLVFQSSGLPTDCVHIRYSEDLGGLSALSGMPNMDYNLYRHTNTCTFTDRRPGSELEAGSFAQWKAHIGGEAHSLTSNPNLAADGSLLAGSPAIDAGDDARCPTTDLRGALRPWDGNGIGGAACDIGAYEALSPAPVFADVLGNHWAVAFIEKLYDNGITGGCSNSPLMYCPDNAVTRAQMAVFLLVAKHGTGYTPPPATGLFNDVPASSGFASWIEQLYNEGITGGCGGGNYCPNAPVTREQMAVFLLMAEHGTGYTPPAATGVFADVPADYPFAPWIEALYAEGITGGCGSGNYCPTGTVTRAQMAVFLVAAFNLP